MRIYLTHCSAKKNAALRTSAEPVPPDRLYTATPTQRFMRTCQSRGVPWAIFSDRYGVWFPDISHPWYEKDPSRVTPAELVALREGFDRALAPYAEIWFYYNPSRFHPLYDRLLTASTLRDHIIRFTHLVEIR